MAELKGDEVVAKIVSIKTSNPSNRMAKFFDVDYYKSLSPEDQEHFLQMCRSGYICDDSSNGFYAIAADDYDKYAKFCDQVLVDYHKLPSANFQHTTSWDLGSAQGGPPNGILDLAAIGSAALSMRVRVGRNLNAFPLPGGMTKDDRIKMEQAMCAVFDKLKSMPEYGGRYHSLTPGHADFIDEKQYNDLVKEHLMFKSMAGDKYLVAAGIANDWPYGRGCYVSQDRGFVIWVGEEDHLRIMAMKKGLVINEVFDRLKTALAVVEAQGLAFAVSPKCGAVTSCPTNIGTGMRASVHIGLPKLCGDGSPDRAKAICKPLGLQVRGLGGEHTPVGEGGIVDISPTARFCISEAQIVTDLYRGIKAVMEAEAQA